MNFVKKYLYIMYVSTINNLKNDAKRHQHYVDIFFFARVPQLFRINKKTYQISHCDNASSRYPMVLTVNNIYNLYAKTQIFVLINCFISLFHIFIFALYKKVCFFLRCIDDYDNDKDINDTNTYSFYFCLIFCLNVMNRCIIYVQYRIL